MQECGSYLSVPIVDQLLDQHGFQRRKALRMQPLSRHPDRDAQFEVIARFKREFLDSLNPVLSIDLKSRQLLGNFFRSGTLWTRETIRVFDHDFAEFAQGVVLPHGIYNLKLNRGYIHLGTSHDTSEFACDSLKDWWQRFGSAAYPEARSLLLLAMVAAASLRILGGVKLTCSEPTFKAWPTIWGWRSVWCIAGGVRRSTTRWNIACSPT